MSTYSGTSLLEQATGEGRDRPLRLAL
ncbi:MAG: hypothetical protein AVDCRST_MAG88-946, partial [uncultured Thermomicrobiales bacterium]